jgi:hypothetical protein
MKIRVGSTHLQSLVCARTRPLLDGKLIKRMRDTVNLLRGLNRKFDAWYDNPRPEDTYETGEQHMKFVLVPLSTMPGGLDRKNKNGLLLFDNDHPQESFGGTHVIQGYHPDRLREFVPVLFAPDRRWSSLQVEFQSDDRAHRSRVEVGRHAGGRVQPNYGAAAQSLEVSVIDHQGPRAIQERWIEALELDGICKFKSVKPTPKNNHRTQMYCSTDPSFTVTNQMEFIVTVAGFEDIHDPLNRMFRAVEKLEPKVLYCEVFFLADLPEYESVRHSFNRLTTAWEYEIRAWYNPKLDPFVRPEHVPPGDPYRLPLCRLRHWVPGEYYEVPICQVDLVHAARGSFLEFQSTSGRKAIEKYAKLAEVSVEYWTGDAHLRWGDE